MRPKLVGIILDVHGNETIKHWRLILFSQNISIFMIYHTLGLQLNLYLYQHDRKSFGNQQRISIVSAWKEQGLTHWKGFHIHNWLCPVSLYSFLCVLITITQNDNRLLSQSPKPSFQQRLLDSETTSHIAPLTMLRAHTHSWMADEISGYSAI